MARKQIAISALPGFQSENAGAFCAGESRRLLEAAGFEVAVFPGDGKGGRRLEAAVASGTIAGVLELCVSELLDESVGGVRRAGANRLTGAALLGIPQVLVPGGVATVAFAGPASIPEEFRGRPLIPLGDCSTLIRTTPEECDRLGREIALKISASRGAAAVVLPLHGVSAPDRDGQSFRSSPADAVLFQSIRNWISPHIRVLELEAHIDDADTARRATNLLMKML